MTDSDFSEIQTDDASDQEFSWPDSSGMGPPAAAGLSPQTWPSSGSYRPRSTSAGSALTSAAIAPVPQARQVPVIQLPHTFEEPRKRISSVMDIDKFQQSETSGKLFLGFVVALSEAIKGHKISDACREGRIVKLLVGILEKMSKWIDDIPPRQQAARYGNPAFRDWHAQLNHQGPALIQEILPEELHPAVVEVFPYFADSCGNSSRIDYGTGHEANFAAFLLCLARLGLVDEGDYQALVARVFVTYLDLMRKLQMTYWLEPAGSHGVWGLDDYHFLPFIFGAAQLTDHKYMKPKSVHNQDILDNFSKEYLYLGCVDFVKKVKKGPLAEHSPMIDDISGVASWNKVHGGMLKMYKVEVLEKVPIMQHFLFGSLIRW